MPDFRRRPRMGGPRRPGGPGPWRGPGPRTLEDPQDLQGNGALQEQLQATATSSPEVQALLDQADAALILEDGAAAKDAAHRAAELARSLRDQGALDGAVAEQLLARAGQLWTTADGLAPATGDGQLDRAPYAVWTTGGSAVGQGTVTSTQLPADGSWDAGDFRGHHSDRSSSWAANQIRDDRNQDLQAYDFTFERTDSQGRAVDGSALGLELHAPADMKVLEIQKSYSGSGGYGMFIHLEDVETGRRIVVNHLDSVEDFAVGQIIPGGTVFGTQGGSGNGRSSYAVHVDIVGGSAAVEDFVRAQQTGTYRTAEGRAPVS